MWLDQERSGHEIIKAAPQKMRGAASCYHEGDTMWQKDIGKYKAFRDNSRKVLFFLCLRRLFPVAGGVDRTALGFRLRFCRVNFPGFSPAVAAGNFLDGHGDKI